MCKHCERIKVDVESIPLIHAFFEDLAKKCNRRAKEDGNELVQPITADDIDITVSINAVVWKPSYIPSDLRGRIIKMLNEFQE